MSIEKLINKLKRYTYTFLALFLAIMSLLALFFHAKATPFPIIRPENTYKLPIMILVEFIICIAIFKTRKIFSKMSNINFMFIILTLYVFFQIVFILLFPLRESLKSDAQIIVNCANAILYENFSFFSIKHYLNYYPNNIGITLFFTFLFLFLLKGIITIRFCNVIFTTTTA